MVALLSYSVQIDYYTIIKKRGDAFALPLIFYIECC